jgi:hypothetical protein
MGNFGHHTGMRRLRTLVITLFLLAAGSWPVLHAAGPSSDELVQNAYQAESQGYLNLAAHYYANAYRLSHHNEGILRSLARVLAKAGHNALAEERWREILSDHPTDSEALRAIAALDSRSAEAAVAAEQGGGDDKLQLPTKADMLWTKGHGAWVYGDARTWIKPLNDYNLSAPRTQRIKYVFPQSGSLVFNAGHAVLTWQPERSTILEDGLLGEAFVYPMIDGKSPGVASISEAEWARVGKEIADKMNADDHISGLQFDIEPEDSKLHALYAAVKRNTTKPVGAAVSIWEPNTFKYLDFVVLMAYDYATPVPDYLARARDQVRAFLRDAHNANTKVLIGAPAIATHHEYEGYSSDPTKAPVGTSYKMAQYVDALRSAVSESLDMDDASFLGLCIWALMPDGGLHKPGDQMWYYPTTVDPKLLESFKLSLGAKGQ